MANSIRQRDKVWRIRRRELPAAFFSGCFSIIVEESSSTSKLVRKERGSAEPRDRKTAYLRETLSNCPLTISHACGKCSFALIRDSRRALFLHSTLETSYLRIHPEERAPIQRFANENERESSVRSRSLPVLFFRNKLENVTDAAITYQR